MRLFVAAAFLSFLTALLVAVGFGCYKGDPPCNPGTVDYPRCDPTQPNWGARGDGGQG